MNSEHNAYKATWRQQWLKFCRFVSTSLNALSGYWPLDNKFATTKPTSNLLNTPPRHYEIYGETYFLYFK